MFCISRSKNSCINGAGLVAIKNMQQLILGILERVSLFQSSKVKPLSEKWLVKGKKRVTNSDEPMKNASSSFNETESHSDEM